MPIRARNRLAVIDWKSGGSLAYFPAPHKFFWAREIERNLGYVYYRKDPDGTFGVGVRQGDHEEMYSAYGIDDEIWARRSRQAHRFARANFALYNAPAGTEQRMAVYFYLSAESSGSNRQAVLAYTNRDRYPPLDGYKVAVSHFHTHFNEYVQDRGSLDARPAWIPAFRALGINIAMMSDFHGDGHAKDPGELRLVDQRAYFEACKRHSTPTSCSFQARNQIIHLAATTRWCFRGLSIGPTCVRAANRLKKKSRISGRSTTSIRLKTS